MDDPFDFEALRVQQPGKLLPNRTSYEILNAERQLLATATDTEAHARLKLLSKPAPDARVVAVSTSAGEPILTLVKHHRERVTDLHGPAYDLIGRIRATHTTRHYTLTDGHDEVVGKVVGDLALKHFPVSTISGFEFARINKTWAGLKDMLTPADHYKVEFSGPVSPEARVLTVMMAIVLDLTLYEPK